EPESRPLIVDVGAGTGKASAPLAAARASVISIEPSLAMIREGLRVHPVLTYACSSAEELPIPAGTARMVTSAQAFHWFDPRKALAEFARILKPDGYVCLFWNTRDLNTPAAELFDRLIHKWNPGHDPGYRARNWGEMIAASGLFKPVDHRQFQLSM